MDLTAMDLRCMQSAFSIVANDRCNRDDELELFVDEIYFEAFSKGEAK